MILQGCLWLISRTHVCHATGLWIDLYRGPLWLLLNQCGWRSFVSLRVKIDATLFKLDVKLRFSSCSKHSIKYRLLKISRLAEKDHFWGPATHKCISGMHIFPKITCGWLPNPMMKNWKWSHTQNLLVMRKTLKKMWIWEDFLLNRLLILLNDWRVILNSFWDVRLRD